MSDDRLSEEEINELLKETNVADDSYPPPPSRAVLDANHYLTDREQDAVGEVGNISLGTAATTLSQLLNQKVEITTPLVEAIQANLLDEEFPIPHVGISVQYTEGFKGLNLLVMKQEDAQVIADLMLGGDGTTHASELNEMQMSAVQEAMNQMMGSSCTSLSTIFDRRIDISPPAVDLFDANNNQGLENLQDEEILIKVSFRLRIGELIDSVIMHLLSIDFAKEIVGLLIQADEEVGAENEGKDSEPVSSVDKVNSLVDEQRLSITEKEDIDPAHHGETSAHSRIQPAAFSDFEEEPLNQAKSRNLDILMDIPLEVTVELGRAQRSIKEILNFTQGSIIELDKLAGEPVDILVNQQLLARGEVVVIDENFGVRVTDIVSRTERLTHIK